MSDLITFLITQLVLPIALAYVYCRRKGIPNDSWRAVGISLIALSLAMVFFIGLLGMPAHVKNVGFVRDRSMGFACGAVGITAGLLMGFIARRSGK